jgi:hypothetical protein
MFKNFKFGAGHALIALGGGVGLTMLVINTSHGLEKGLYLAVVFFFSEASRIAIPFIASNKGWFRELKFGFAAAIAISVFASTNFFADKFAVVLLGWGKQTEVQDDRKVEIAKLETKIGEIKEIRSSASLTKLAEGEKVNKFCGPKCLNWQALAAKAEGREKLEAELKTLKTTQVAAAPVEVSGLGLMIAKVTGLDVQTASGLNLAIGGLLILYAFDLLVYLIIPGSRMLQEDKRNIKAEQFGVTVTKLTGKDKPTKIGKQEAYELLINRLIDMPDGSMLISRRQLCKIILGTESRKTTFNDWMNDWIAKDMIKAVAKDETKANGRNELISLPKAA